MRLHFRWPIAVIAAFLLLPSVAAKGQVFEPQAGSSTLFDASGASLTFQGPNYQGRVGGGSVNGRARFGGLLKFRVRNDWLSVGDENFPFDLPTDVFDGGHFFLGRGVSLSHTGKKLRGLGFLGTTSTWFQTPFFQAAQSNRTQGLLFLDYDASNTVRLFSRNVFASRQTTINGLAWRPRRDLQMALASGIGANHGYFSSSLSEDRSWVSVKAAYVASDRQFRRAIVPASVEEPETDGENILVTLRPKPFVTLTAEHQNLIAPVQDARDGGLRATVNEYSVNLNAGGFRLTGSSFESRVQAGRSQGTLFSAGRRIGSRLSSDFTFLHSRSIRGVRTNTLTADFRETLSPRLSLLQVITHSDGQNTLSFGGDFVSNRLAIGITYQTLFVPFARGNPFQQTLAFHIQLQLFGNAHLSAETFTQPDGTVKYSVYGGTFLYRQEGLLAETGAPPISFPKYVIRGRVVDSEGRLVSGAALRIGKDVVFTDSQGEFFLRERKRRSYPLEVLSKQFLVPGNFEVVSAPKSVTPEPEGKAAEVTITVRRA